MTAVGTGSTQHSIANRINGERLALLGWSRAILLQMAHPLIAAGVAEHSGFRLGPLAAARRLHGTVRAMLGLTFGSERDRRLVTEGILAIHRRVNGRLRQSVGVFEAGTPYSAEDPNLVLWVHATLIESTLLAYRALVGDITSTEADEYCEVASAVAIDLGAEPRRVPTDVGALNAYLETMYASGTIAVGADATLVATAVLNGPLSRLAFPVGRINRLITTAWLPDQVRAAYGLPWSASRARRAARLCARIKGVRRWTPHALARFPETRPRSR